MSTVGSLTLSGPHLSGVETGAQFAERVSARAASGCGPLTVPHPLASLLPSHGLERGSVYCLGGDASLSLLAAFVSSATQDGSWLSLVNLQQVGFLALHEYGVALHRTVSVSVERNASWGAVVGALVDGFDLVAVSAPQCSPAEARRITARVKAQSSVLFLIGAPGPFLLMRHSLRQRNNGSSLRMQSVAKCRCRHRESVCMAHVHALRIYRILTDLFRRLRHDTHNRHCVSRMETAL